MTGLDREALRPGTGDRRRSAPHVARTTDPILAILGRVLPETGVVLEVASGTGEHALHFARALPGLLFQPSDMDEDSLASIAAWRREEGPDNLLEPVKLDVAEAGHWPTGRVDAILAINMVHISRWAATMGLMAAAGRLLPAGAPLILYGAFLRDGVPTAPGNAAFDESLRSRNPEWGVRRLEDVAAEAGANGLALDEVIEMPSDNLTLVFRR